MTLLRPLNLSALIAAGLTFSSIAASADPVVIDFGGYGEGTDVSNTFVSDGLTIATRTSGGSYGQADTSAGSFTSIEGVSNSTSGVYPTTEYLDFNFSSAVELSSFTFDNYGDNSGPGSSYAAFDSDGNLLGSGSLASVNDSLVTVDLSGVALLEFSNGESFSSWEYVVSNVTYTPTPDGGTTAVMLGAGLICLVALRRRFARA